MFNAWHVGETYTRLRIRCDVAGLVGGWPNVELGQNTITTISLEIVSQSLSENLKVILSRRVFLAEKRKFVNY